jgi:hypothetical protein
VEVERGLDWSWSAIRREECDWRLLATLVFLRFYPLLYPERILVLPIRTRIKNCHFFPLIRTRYVCICTICVPMPNTGTLPKLSYQCILDRYGTDNFGKTHSGDQSCKTFTTSTIVYLERIKEKINKKDVLKECKARKLT